MFGNLFNKTKKVLEDFTVVEGAEYKVGEFFWINSKDFLGYADNAEHGHGLDRDPGSADESCNVRVLKVGLKKATVVLLRPEIPYGALAPIGTIFNISLSSMAGWPRSNKDRISRMASKQTELEALGKVIV